MAVGHNPATPVRRSKRGQPILKVSGSPDGTGESSAGFQTRDPVWTRPTRAEDLSESLLDRLQEEDFDIENYETRFFDSFDRQTAPKHVPKVYGKGKKVATAPTSESFKIGDTVLVATTREPSVAVITAVWQVVGGDDENHTHASLHWFLKPNQLASIRARREHLENEIYYSLDGNITVPATMVLSRCTVSQNAQTQDSFRCLSAMDARRGLYYEFDWDLFRDKALEVPDFWDSRDQWDMNSEDIVPATPARSRVGSSLESSDDGETPRAPKKSKQGKPSEIQTDVVSGPGRKRKRPASAGISAKRTRSHNKSTGFNSSDSGSSDEYTEPQGSPDSGSDDELIKASPEDAESSSSEAEFDEEEEIDAAPHTPRKPRGPRPGTPRTPKTPRTPRNKRGVKLAAPTPHSKAALRARASRKRVLAVRPPPPDRAYDVAFLNSVPKDPWLRAMHALHVASRPDALPCRDEEYGRVLRSVEELLDEGSGGCVYISGVPGTGKTATVHAVVRELKRMAEQDEGNPFTYVEINGLRIPNPSAAYGLLWEAVSGHDSSKEGHLKISSKEALKQLTKYFSSSERAGPGGHACVVLMDELDQLMTTKQDVVYNFFNWPTLVGSKLVVIAVANTMDLPERVMSGRVRSRLGMIRINFQAYNANQLVEIVNSRLTTAKASLPNNQQEVVAPDGVMFAAKKVSNISGDARRVLDICRRAVELVRPLKKTARIPDVQQVVKDMQNSPTAAYLRELSFHERVMLVAVIKCVRKEGVEEIRWGDIKRQHLLVTDQLGEDPDTMRRPTTVEFFTVLDSLAASRSLLYEEGIAVARKSEDDRRVIMTLEQSEVERVLGEFGTKWRNLLNN